LDIDTPSTLRARLMPGLMVIVAGASIFAALATQLGQGQTMRHADQAVADALRTGVPQAVRDVFAALTHLADTSTLTALCVAVALVLCAGRRFALASGWVFAVAGNGLLNTTLKGLFGRDRPLPADGAALLAGFSFPSGHSAGAVVAYGMLAYLGMRLLAPRWQAPAVAAAGVLAGLVGLSRLVLGVHFASDVVAGLASGTAWLTLCVTLVELARWRGSPH
jgi:membrane-associated phospholipid phosphatase